MRKILMVIPLFLLWMIVFVTSISARLTYAIGDLKGMNCTGTKHGLFSFEARYDPTSLPERNFITWKDFWSYYGY